jgi:hypothetical protein
MEFLKDVLIMKLVHHASLRSITIDIPYLDNPKWLSVRILPESYKEKILEQVKFMRDNACGHKGFQSWEADKLERITYILESEPEKTHLKDFALFFDEHDKRRGSNLLKTFPEFTDFYNHCKTIE